MIFLLFFTFSLTQDRLPSALEKLPLDTNKTPWALCFCPWVLYLCLWALYLCPCALYLCPCALYLCPWALYLCHICPEVASCSCLGGAILEHLASSPEIKTCFILRFFASNMMYYSREDPFKRCV